MKIKRDDIVTVLSGKDAGKTGKVQKVFTKDSKVLIENVGAVKRHMKARQQGQQSEILTLFKPVTMANVALVCPRCKKLTRVGYVVEKNEKVRVCRKCGKKI